MQRIPSLSALPDDLLLYTNRRKMVKKNKITEERKEEIHKNAGNSYKLTKFVALLLQK